MKKSIKPIIIVEGKYDKIKLENLVNGIVVATEGFGIFKDHKAQQNIKTLAKHNGAVILTDSDRAGFVIRKRLHDLLNDCEVVDLYIPDIYGKERRKDQVSAEGKLGVEGMPDEVLVDLFDGLNLSTPRIKSAIKVLDLYECGMFGSADSAGLRRDFQAWLGLPGRLNKNMLLKVLSELFTREQFYAEWQRYIKEKDPQ
ncbi:MAG: DUF4093 domain-containing protein [Clostridia bacterium]|nr:DUF4093 domain-containing protein [Clostridia bacterium]